jgi:hypothetical protein
MVRCLPGFATLRFDIVPDSPFEKVAVPQRSDRAMSVNDGFWYGGGLLDVTVPFLVARDDRKPWIEQKAGKPVFVPDHTRR